MSEHGYVAYTKGCRCDICRGAKADYMRERRALARTVAQRHTVSSTGKRSSRQNARTPGATRHVAPIARHGTRYGYEEAGCRCFDCTDARTAADRRYLAGGAA